MFETIRVDLVLPSNLHNLSNMSQALGNQNSLDSSFNTSSKRTFHHVGVTESLELWQDDIVLVWKFQMKYVHLRFSQGSYDPHCLFHKE